MSKEEHRKAIKIIRMCIYEQDISLTIRSLFTIKTVREYLAEKSTRELVNFRDHVSLFIFKFIVELKERFNFSFYDL